jgi:excisionase family DNA binding protein
MTLALTQGELAIRLTKAFYSPAEVAELASVSSSTILNYIHDGRLAATRLSDRVYRVPRKAVIRLLAPDEAAETIRIVEPDRIPED